MHKTIAARPAEWSTRHSVLYQERAGGEEGVACLGFFLLFFVPPHTLPSHFDYTSLVAYESNPKHYSCCRGHGSGVGED